jgi:glyoxylase-like metal-dependent hydrolase (beta-lactamase superfamily II)/ferredoxin
VARTDLRNPANAEGDWFVDVRCIDCGTCRDLAPGLFRAVGGRSVVSRPVPPDDVPDAWLAAQACPTNSIGTLSRQPRPGRLYPREIEVGSGVYDLGYCSENSFGASAWFVRRQAGNILIDSPRFTQALVDPIATMGGVAHVVLTHQDDVADADRYAGHFGARVWIHEDDRSAAPYATDLFRGNDPTEVTPGFVSVPVPGHTKGSVVFLLDGHYLFSGDSLAWSHERQDLVAFAGACWYSWSTQTRSLERLAHEYRFACVLPGHGARTIGDPDDLHERLVRLTRRMPSMRSRRA